MSETKTLVEAKFPGWEASDVRQMSTLAPGRWEDSDTVGLADMQIALGVAHEQVDELVAASNHYDDEIEVVIMKPKGVSRGLEKRCIVSNGRIVAVQG